jgi:Zn-dependent metalloprotease
VVSALVKQYALGQSASESGWLIGAGLISPGISDQALRSLRVPGTAYDNEQLGKDPQRAHMSGYVQTESDNGGVHINSGIPNHAFYLLAASLGWVRVGESWHDLVPRSHQQGCHANGDLPVLCRIDNGSCTTRPYR